MVTCVTLATSMGGGVAIGGVTCVTRNIYGGGACQDIQSDVHCPRLINPFAVPLANASRVGVCLECESSSPTPLGTIARAPRFPKTSPLSLPKQLCGSVDLVAE